MTALLLAAQHHSRKIFVASTDQSINWHVPVRTQSCCCIL